MIILILIHKKLISSIKIYNKKLYKWKIAVPYSADNNDGWDVTKSVSHDNNYFYYRKLSFRLNPKSRTNVHHKNIFLHTISIAYFDYEVKDIGALSA